MFDWLKDNEALAWWLGISSVVMFVGSLVLVPWLLARLPTDYFIEKKRPPSPIVEKHPGLRVPLLILRNVLGVIILLAGVAMLLLPGQGILAILVGLMLVSFPGKFRLQRWIIRKPKVNKAINWLRAKAHREPLELPA